jgi:hypothetical protein
VIFGGAVVVGVQGEFPVLLQLGQQWFKKVGDRVVVQIARNKTDLQGPVAVFRVAVRRPVRAHTGFESLTKPEVLGKQLLCVDALVVSDPEQQVAVRKVVVGLDGQCLPTGVFGLGGAAEVAERDAEIEQRHGHFRLESQGVAKARLGFTESPLLAKVIGQIVVRLCKIRFVLQRTAQAIFAFRQLPQLLECRAHGGECFGEFRLALQGTPPGRQRLVQATLITQRGAQVEVRLGEIGSVLHRVTQGTDGFVQTVLFTQRSAERGEGLREVRLAVQRAAPRCLRFVETTLITERAPQVVVSRGEVRPTGERAPESVLGFAQSAELPECVAQVVVRFDEFWMQRQCPAVSGFGLGQEAAVHQCVAEVAVGKRKVRLQAYRSPIADFRFRLPALRAEDIAEVEMGFGEVWLELQRFPVAGLGLWQFFHICQHQAKIALDLLIPWQQFRRLPHGGKRLGILALRLEYCSQDLPAETMSRKPLGQFARARLAFAVATLIDQFHQLVFFPSGRFAATSTWASPGKPAARRGCRGSLCLW